MTNLRPIKIIRRLGWFLKMLRKLSKEENLSIPLNKDTEEQA